MTDFRFSSERIRKFADILSKKTFKGTHDYDDGRYKGFIESCIMYEAYIKENNIDNKQYVVDNQFSAAQHEISHLKYLMRITYDRIEEMENEINGNVDKKDVICSCGYGHGPYSACASRNRCKSTSEGYSRYE